jgi:hypothetical protein
MIRNFSDHAANERTGADSARADLALAGVMVALGIALVIYLGSGHESAFYAR